MSLRNGTKKKKNTNSSANTNSSSKPKKSGNIERHLIQNKRDPPPGCEFVNFRRKCDFDMIKEPDYVPRCTKTDKFWWPDDIVEKFTNQLSKYNLLLKKISHNVRVFRCFKNLYQWSKYFGYSLLYQDRNQLKKELTANGELTFLFYLIFGKIYEKNHKNNNKNEVSGNGQNKKSGKKQKDHQQQLRIVMAEIKNWQNKYKHMKPQWQQEYEQEYNRTKGINNNSNNKK